MNPSSRETNPGPALLEEFAEHLAGEGLSPNTIENYLADLRRFCRWLGTQGEDACLDELDVGNIARYCRYLIGEARLRPSTVRRHLQSLRCFCRFLGRSWEGPGVRLDAVDTSHPPKVLTLEETEKVLAVARDGSEQAERDYALVQTMLQVGLRVGEVAELRLSQVEVSEDSGFFRLADGRVIPLNSSIRWSLLEYLRVRPGHSGAEYLFLTRDGAPLSKRSIQKLVADCARRAGLSGTSARTLRSTCARYLLEETGDLGLVSKLLGHTRLESTSKYLLTPKGKDAGEALESCSLNALSEVRNLMAAKALGRGKG